MKAKAYLEEFFPGYISLDILNPVFVTWMLQKSWLWNAYYWTLSENHFVGNLIVFLHLNSSFWLYPKSSSHNWIENTRHFNHLLRIIIINSNFEAHFWNPKAQSVSLLYSEIPPSRTLQGPEKKFEKARYSRYCMIKIARFDCILINLMVELLKSRIHFLFFTFVSLHVKR